MRNHNSQTYAQEILPAAHFCMGLALVFVLCRAAVSTAAGAEPAQATSVYAIEPQFRLLRFGEIKPLGWIREQMRRDLGEGFAGHLPEIAPHRPEEHTSELQSLS